MTATKYVTIWCDAIDDLTSCGEQIETPEHENHLARERAARYGWTYEPSTNGAGRTKGRDFCPQHSRR